MTDRNPRVKLPDSEARCNPSGICHAAAKCARALAPMPATGAVVVDGWAENIQARGLSPTAIVSCRRYVVPQYVSKTADAPEPVRKKWIGEQ